MLSLSPGGNVKDNRTAGYLLPATHAVPQAGYANPTNLSAAQQNFGIDLKISRPLIPNIWPV
jgi:hypothetical protein